MKRFKRIAKIIGPLLVLAIFIGAVLLLRHSLQKYTWHTIVEDMRRTSWAQIFAAFGLSVVGYVILVGYDFLALRFVQQKLPLYKIALASFISYAFSYNFGATLAGAPIRYRLYAGWKVPALKIVELLVILGLTLWFGLFFLAGVLFTFDPLTIPAELLHKLAHHHIHLPTKDFRFAGIILLITAMSYIGLAAFFQGHIKMWKWNIPVPPFRLTLYQYIISTADFIVAAGVLYVLLPPGGGVNFALVLEVYILAYVVEVISHSPYGVFDAMVIGLLPGDVGELAAVILLFRVIYRLGPVLLAAGLLGLNELLLRRAGLSQVLHAVENLPHPHGHAHPQATPPTTPEKGDAAPQSEGS